MSNEYQPPPRGSIEDELGFGRPARMTTDTACPEDGSACPVLAQGLTLTPSMCAGCPQARPGATDAAGHAERAWEWERDLSAARERLAADQVDALRLALGRVDGLAKAATAGALPGERVLAWQILSITGPALREENANA